MGIAVGHEDRLVRRHRDVSGRFVLLLPPRLRSVVRGVIGVRGASVSRVLGSLRRRLSLPTLDCRRVGSTLCFVVGGGLGRPLRTSLVANISIERDSPLCCADVSSGDVRGACEDTVLLVNGRYPGIVRTGLHRSCGSGSRGVRHRDCVNDRVTLGGLAYRGFFTRLTGKTRDFGKHLRQGLDVQGSHCVRRFGTCNV